MPLNKLIPAKIKGTFTEIEHHTIAAKLKVISDKWDEIEEQTGVKPPMAYAYSFGLIMSKELIFHSLPENIANLRLKILTARVK